MPLRLMAGLYLWIAWIGVALADDPTPIGLVTDDPDAYNLRSVTLEGAVTSVKLLEPYAGPSGRACFGGYTFQLQDDTGALTIAVLGLCGMFTVKTPDVADGDRILLRAQIHAPDRPGLTRKADGHLLTNKELQGVHAVAGSIQVLTPSIGPSGDPPPDR